MKKIQTINTIAMVTIVATALPTFAHDLQSGIVIRKVSNSQVGCSEKAIFTNPENLDQYGRAHHLSVNCTTDTNDIEKYTRYLTGLNGQKFCVARVVDVNRNGGRVRTAPIHPGNPDHCLIDNIPGKDLANKMKLRP